MEAWTKSDKYIPGRRKYLIPLPHVDENQPDNIGHRKAATPDGFGEKLDCGRWLNTVPAWLWCVVTDFTLYDEQEVRKTDWPHDTLQLMFDDLLILAQQYLIPLPTPRITERELERVVEYAETFSMKFWLFENPETDIEVPTDSIGQCYALVKAYSSEAELSLLRVLNDAAEAEIESFRVRPQQ
ncbi:hypothetical protein ABW21_db0205644 [Orbilia brochopaga]|nr:hypothetical protein ABW21_db0205644 [Drechslerella brochopaga]